MLGALRSEWAPEAFLISFKLETDDRILIIKVCPAPLTMPLTICFFFHRFLLNLTLSCFHKWFQGEEL